MPEITNAILEIDSVADKPGQRRVRVTYDLTTPKDDEALRQMVTETIVLHGVDCHDAPVDPDTDPVSRVQAVYAATEGTVHRLVDQTMGRTSLDVEQDWWTSAQDGDVIPIAEWIDHLVADIGIVCNGKVQAEGSTPAIAGSWGVLGDD